MNFFIKTFGCQYNEWDAAKLSYALKKADFKETGVENAEIVFVINCSVRQTAVDRTYGFAKNMAEQQKKVIVTGCLLERDKKMFEKKNVIVWDINQQAKLAGTLGLPIEAFKTTKEQPFSNFVPIMKGCNNFCSYCAVPYTRGREISRPMEEIVANVKKIVEAGHKEIWLLGQNVNSYNPNKELGIRNKGKSDFSILLEEINALPGDFIVYFTSNHPKDMSDDIIEAIATLPKIAKRIHLPLQSGSNKILKAMNRPYTIEQYLTLIDKIRKKIPDIEITTDTIVGFPGETKADFEKTVKVFKKVGFFQAFNNKYSPRSGTKAFDLGDPIPWAEKQRRWRILNELANGKYIKKR